MSTTETTIADETRADDEEPAAGTRFYKALHWQVYDPEEALWIAATHRRRAAEARSGIPVIVDTYQRRCMAAGLEQRACREEEIAAVCERHAARLRAQSHARAEGCPV